MRTAFVFGFMFLIASCATAGSRSSVENALIDFGFSEERSECLAYELDQRLDRSDMADVAYFLENINDASSAGGALDALLQIDNARAAAAIGPAGLACAFG